MKINENYVQIINKYFVKYGKHNIEINGSYTLKKHKINTYNILDHIKGNFTLHSIGGYVNKIQVYDVDYKTEADREYAYNAILKVLMEDFGIREEEVYVHVTGNKGFHIILFFNSELYENLSEFVYEYTMYKVNKSVYKIENIGNSKKSVRIPYGVRNGKRTMLKQIQNGEVVDIESLEQINEVNVELLKILIESRSEEYSLKVLKKVNRQAKEKIERTLNNSEISDITRHQLTLDEMYRLKKEDYNTSEIIEYMYELYNTNGWYNVSEIDRLIHYISVEKKTITTPVKINLNELFNILVRNVDKSKMSVTMAHLIGYKYFSQNDRVINGTYKLTNNLINLLTGTRTAESRNGIKEIVESLPMVDVISNYSKKVNTITGEVVEKTSQLHEINRYTFSEMVDYELEEDFEFQFDVNLSDDIKFMTFSEMVIQLPKEIKDYIMELIEGEKSGLTRSHRRVIVRLLKIEESELKKVKAKKELNIKKFIKDKEKQRKIEERQYEELIENKKNLEIVDVDFKYTNEIFNLNIAYDEVEVLEIKKEHKDKRDEVKVYKQKVKEIPEEYLPYISKIKKLSKLERTEYMSIIKQNKGLFFTLKLKGYLELYNIK